MQAKAAPVRKVLVVTAVENAGQLATAISQGAKAVVALVRSRRAALALLRRESHTVVLMDSALPEGERTSAEMVWLNSNGAVPLEVNVQAVGAAGLVRLLRNLLERWEQLEMSVRHDVERTYVEQLRSTVTGMLLHSDLALRDTTLAPTVEQRVREVRALADTLRARLLPV